jgi:hypothetical protein
MDLIYDTVKNKNKILKSIKKYGFSPEHNYNYYQNEQTDTKKNIFFLFEKGMGVLAQRTTNGKSWSVISSVLAPEEKRQQIFLRFLDYIFRKRKTEKVWVEFTEDFRRELLDCFKREKKYRACRVNEILLWPVFDMRKWDGHKLEGKEWKKMRNIKNRFYKSHDVEVNNSIEFSKEQLNEIVKEWIKRRSQYDRTHADSYFNLIKNDFEGYDFARTMVVDGEPCTITCGWRIPNSNDYYSNIGILNYRCAGLGEISNWEDLVHLKKQGFRYVDFGGSDEYLLNFKMKFRPHKIYKTYIFSIKRNEH